MMEEGIWYWVGFLVFVVVMLLLDLGVFHKKDQPVGVKEALAWSAFWISLALLFCVGVYFFIDHGKAFDFFTAYLLEKSLSVDNLFVFILIFGYFNVGQRYQHKILFWGILGALAMRALFIFAGVAIIQRFSWVMYLFGAFLLYSGVQMLFKNKKRDENFDPNKNFAIKLFRKFFPVTDHNEEGKFIVRRDGRRMATSFLLTLIFIEASDLIFAVDSIPAVLSVSTDTFIVFTSNIFAILGLRSLYFALNGIMQYFRFISYALAGILSFIGLKMVYNEMAHHFDWAFHISNFASLGVIVALLTVSIALSIKFPEKKS